MPRAGGAHYWPCFLPDGRRFLYLARSQRRENDAIVWARWIGPETQKPIRLLAANSNAVYAPPRHGRTGHLLVGLDRTLTARQFDATRLQMEGEPVALAEEVGYIPLFGWKISPCRRRGYWSTGGKGAWRN